MNTCAKCGRELAWDGRWVHKDGGGLYWMTCPDCGWGGAPAGYPAPTKCPVCGGRKISDNHIALWCPPHPPGTAVQRYFEEKVNFGGIPTSRYQVYRVMRANGFTDGEIDWYLFCLDHKRAWNGNGE